MRLGHPVYEGGKLETVVGCMSSGKTEQLLALVQRLEWNLDIRSGIYKPKVDDRTEDEVASRDGRKEPAKVIESPEQIFNHLEDQNVVFLDEVQFYEKKETVQVVEELLRRGIDVLAFGLNLNFRGEEFPTVAALMARSYSHPVFMKAFCSLPSCNDLADRTQRLFDEKPAPYNSPLVIIGGDEKRPFVWRGKEVEVTYKPRCEKHHEVPGKPRPYYKS